MMQYISSRLKSKLLYWFKQSVTVSAINPHAKHSDQVHLLEIVNVAVEKVI